MKVFESSCEGDGRERKVRIGECGVGGVWVGGVRVGGVRVGGKG